MISFPHCNRFTIFLVAGLIIAGLGDATSAKAQKNPPTPRRDTLTVAERDALREASRDARSMARKNLGGDSAVRAERAAAAASTAFADGEAKTTLEKARFARVSQDSALRAYRATTTQRISVGLGVRRVGVEKLLWRMDNVAQVAWKREVGVRVTPVGSRMTIPMASVVDGDVVDAVSIPYFPGRESLWFPSSNFGVVKTDIDEREMIHPLARGAEAYYRYESGDSVDIKLPDGRVIALRELRITPRTPKWRLFVGSFWFDRDGGQLVRAAYRLPVDIEIWDVVDEESVNDAVQNAEANRLRDSIARERLPRETYVKDSTLRADRLARSKRSGSDNTDDGPPLWVKSTFRPAKAKLDAITVEYGLYQGRFWLPRANSASASMQLGFVRVPVRIDEKFSYEDVNADFSLASIPPAQTLTARQAIAAETSAADSAKKSAETLAANGKSDSAAVAESNGGSVSLSVGLGGSADTGTVEKARRERVERQRYGAAKARQCEKDSTWTRTQSRFDGALRIAFDMPCDMTTLSKSDALPPAYASDEELFDIKSRDELLSALDMSLQPAFAPMPIRLRTGVDLLRYNRVEGISVAAVATEELGAGYSLRAIGRIGHADLHANGELSLARSNGSRTVTGTLYHRLAAANPEWGGALTFGPSLPALIYARDEGFYYRTFGFELRETRDVKRGALDYGLFVERQYTAGDSDVVNTFSIAGLVSDKKFRGNINADPASVTGVSANYIRAFGEDPASFRFITATRAEAGTGTFEYGRLSLEATVTRPISRVSLSLTGSAGTSAGRVPAQRQWYVGGLKTVRGQIAGTQSGDAYWLSRAEVGTRFAFVRPVLFYDVGWAGTRTDFGGTKPQRGAGFGFGFLDGFFRIDFARGIYPNKGWRTDFYLGAPL